MPDEGLRARLRSRIDEIGQTDRSVSLAAGMSSTAVRDIFRRPETSPTLATITKLAAALNTTPEWLAFGVQALNRQPAISEDGERALRGSIDEVLRVLGYPVEVREDLVSVPNPVLFKMACCPRRYFPVSRSWRYEPSRLLPDRGRPLPHSGPRPRRAYAIARQEARAERTKLRRPGPWNRVRQEVGWITGRESGADTGTRMAAEDLRLRRRGV